MENKVPIRDHMASEAWYQELDQGIRFAVRVLHAKCFETCQSCQGGKGHSYDRPTIDLIATADDANGFGALAALHDYGLPVRDVSLLWQVNKSGVPGEKIWRITFWKTFCDRADEKPNFIFGYRAQGSHS